MTSRNRLYAFSMILGQVLLMMHHAGTARADGGLLHTTATLSEARHSLAAASVGDHALFAGGVIRLGSLYSSRVDIFNGATGQWSVATLSQGRRDLAATSVGDYGLFAGGWRADDSDRVDIFNEATGQWSTAALSQARASLAATAVGNYALFGGGEIRLGTAYSSVVDIFDSSTGQWSTATLSRRRSGLAATSAGNYAIFAGGAFGGGRDKSDVVDIFNASTGQWSATTLSQARHGLAATTVGDYALFAGGFLVGSSDPSNVVDIFDATTGQWSTATLSQSRGQVAATAVGGYAIFGGGWRGSPSDVVDIFDGSTGQWSTATLSQTRHALAATSVGDHAIVAGGSTVGYALSDVVDIYTIPEPSFALLAGVGLAWLLRRRRYRTGRPGRREASAGRPATLGLLGLLLAGGTVLTALSHSAGAQSQFHPPEMYNVGEHPYGVAAADLNRDGRMDLVCANAYGGTLSVLYGQPAGGFGDRRDYTINDQTDSDSCWGVAAIDVNADGRLDLVTTDIKSADVAVWYAQPDGSFGNLARYPINAGPFLFTHGDFNRDGRPDVAASNLSHDTVSVIYGVPGGGFGPPTAYAVGDQPQTILTADFDGNGWPDLAVAAYASHEVTILYNQADGTFGGRYDIPARYPTDLAAVDLTGDAPPELVVGNDYSEREINVYERRPDGSFQNIQTVASDATVLALAVADLTGDGLPDLAIGRQSHPGLALADGQPGGGFGAAAAYTGYSGLAYRITVADLDGNGGLDLVLSDYAADKVWVLYNTIPEPATLALLALGGLALISRRGRR